MTHRSTLAHALLCLLVLAHLHPGDVIAQPASIQSPSLDRQLRGKKGFVHELPAGLEAPHLRALWRRGTALEEDDRFLEAAEVYEEMALEAPSVAFGFWKVSRNLWRHAEALPGTAKRERLPIFVRAQDWASRGLAVDADCAECMLWKFGAMGRIATTRGVLSSLSAAPEMRDLLEEGIALRPAYADAPDNTALGNLYYAAAVFYRVVPDWQWLSWFIGVKGDLDRSLEMIRHALQISPRRVDYSVELGAILACYGERRDAEWARLEGQRVLDRAGELPNVMDQDPLDKQHAGVLMREPEKACGYSRDGWIEMEEPEQRSARLD